MQVKRYGETYREHVRSVTDRPNWISDAVGGHFEEFGALMRDLLAEFGLRDSHYLIDVGCGSGRLAHKLSVERYLGTDVVPALLNHARSICPHPAWRFEFVDDILIPETDGVADMVCFFSVFTHLMPVDCFRYLTEARRVLKPDGKVVFSFLEFRAPNHWTVFEGMVRDRALLEHHNQFLDRDGIRLWAKHTGFHIEVFLDGETHPLGQSVCVLEAA
jgi:SAM-dependent methyltransferase